jgi:hypothetical protein
MNNDLARALDIFASTDKVVIDEDGLVYLIGQRIQRQRYAKYKSFTIREKRYYFSGKTDGYESEFYKLKKGLDKNSIHACYICHCYVNGNEVDEVTDIILGFIVKTEGLFKFMYEHPQKVHSNYTNNDKEGTQTFKFVYFKDIQRYAPHIIIAEYKDGKAVKFKERMISLDFFKK